MECKKCGGWIPEGAGICAFCGEKVENYTEIMNENRERFGMEQCPKCGHIGAGVPEKMLRKIDWVIIIFTFFSGIGAIYLLLLYIKKGDPAKRNKVCPICGTIIKESSIGGELNLNKGDIDKTKNIVLAVAKNPEIRKGIKDIKNSAKDFHNTFYTN